MKVCLGGTFNILHDGHKRFLDKALDLAGNSGSVHIGITVVSIVYKKKNLNSFEYRRRAILNYISTKKKKGVLVELLPIVTSFGLAVDEDYDVIVVSPETRSNAEEINKLREKSGNKPLDIIEIPYVLAKDGKPISTTRIINKEIDSMGNIL